MHGKQGWRKSSCGFSSTTVRTFPSKRECHELQIKLSMRKSAKHSCLGQIAKVPLTALPGLICGQFCRCGGGVMPRTVEEVRQSYDCHWFQIAPRRNMAGNASADGADPAGGQTRKVFRRTRSSYEDLQGLMYTPETKITTRAISDLILIASGSTITPV
jgi:hypothetical protein